MNVLELTEGNDPSPDTKSPSVKKCGAEPRKSSKVEVALMKAATEDRTGLWESEL